MKDEIENTEEVITEVEDPTAEPIGFAKIFKEQGEKPIEEEAQPEAQELEQVEVEEEPEEEPEDLTKVDEDFNFEDEVEEVEEEKPMNDTEAIKRAKEEGRRRKELEAELADRDVELDNYRKQVEELQGVTKEKDMALADPMQDSEYKALYSDIITETEDLLSEVDYGSGVQGVNLVAEFVLSYKQIKGLPLSERREAINNMKGDIAFKFSGMSQEDWEDDIDGKVSTFKGQSKDIFKFIKDIEPDVSELQSMSDNIKNNSEEYQVSKRATGYKETSERVSDLLDSIKAVDDETIELDPYDIANLTAKKVKNGKAEKAFEAVKSDIILAETGGRVYTAEERKLLKSQGKSDKDITDLEKKSAKASMRKREQHNNIIAHYRIMQPEIKKMMKENAELKRKISKIDKSDNAKADLLDKPTADGASAPDEKIGFARFMN